MMGSKTLLDAILINVGKIRLREFTKEPPHIRNQLGKLLLSNDSNAIAKPGTGSEFVRRNNQQSGKLGAWIVVQKPCGGVVHLASFVLVDIDASNGDLAFTFNEQVVP